jgi:transketolase
MDKVHPSQRGWFAHELHNQMSMNNDIFVLTGDLGYGQFDRIRDDFSDRFINCGASEQGMMGIAVGLALKGKIPFVYSITNFLIYRPFETIKLYVNDEKIPVRLVGGGLFSDYEHDGPSHDMTDIRKTLDTLQNIHQLYPETKEEVPDMVKDMVRDNKPWFIGVRR